MISHVLFRCVSILLQQLKIDYCLFIPRVSAEMFDFSFLGRTHFEAGGRIEALEFGAGPS